MWIFVIAISATTCLYGFASSLIVYFLLLFQYPYTEILVFSFISNFLVSLGTYYNGLMNHYKEAENDQLFIFYDLVRIIFPIILVGIKLGYIMLFINEKAKVILLLIISIILIFLLIKNYKKLHFHENFLNENCQEINYQEDFDSNNTYLYGFLNTNYTDYSDSSLLPTLSKKSSSYKSKSFNFYTHNNTSAVGNIKNNLFKKRSRQQEILLEIEKNSKIQLDFMISMECKPIREDFISQIGLVILQFIIFQLLYYFLIGLSGFLILCSVILLHIYEAYIYIETSKEKYEILNNTYKLKKDLVKNYTCQLSEYCLKYHIYLTQFIALVSFINFSLGIPISIFILLIFSHINMNQYASACTANFCTMLCSFCSICYMFLFASFLLWKEGLIFGLICVIINYFYDKKVRIYFFKLKKQAKWYKAFLIGLIFGVLFVLFSLFK